jgi:IS4 transposase
VCRIRDNSVYKVVEERELTKAAIAERVTGDTIITLGGKTSTKLDHKVRLITIAAKPHVKRTAAPAPNCDGTIRIVTNLLDVPADVIALLYHYRWTIEIFFRFMKQTLGCRHLLSGSQKGIEIQTYCAIIACMLISLWTGRKPTLRTVEMICFYFMGIAELDELMTHIDKLKKHDAK